MAAGHCEGEDTVRRRLGTAHRSIALALPAKCVMRRLSGAQLTYWCRGRLELQPEGRSAPSASDVVARAVGDGDAVDPIDCAM